MCIRERAWRALQEEGVEVVLVNSNPATIMTDKDLSLIHIYVESSMLYFCSKVVKYNKVTLTGECADEIFGGYPWFHKEECFKAEIFPWSMDMQPRKIDVYKRQIWSIGIRKHCKDTTDHQ